MNHSPTAKYVVTFSSHISTNCFLVAAMIGLSFGHASTVIAADEDAASPEQRAAILKTFRDEVTPFLKKYCTECHGDNRKKGDVSFSGVFGRPGGGEFRRLWQATLVNVKDHSMPPEDAPKQPTDEERR